MDAHFRGDVDRARDRGVGRARDQDFHRSRAAVRENGTRLEWPAIEGFQVSFFPVGSRRRFERILWRAPSGQAPNRDCLSADPSASRLRSDLYRRTLPIRRCLCGRSRNCFRGSRLAIYPSQNRKSAVENRKLEARRG
jgi:hypothetical protein